MRRLTKSTFQALVSVAVAVAVLPLTHYIVYELVGSQRALATGALLGVAWLLRRLVYEPLAKRLTDDQA
jgi:hypothetical protein